MCKDCSNYNSQGCAYCLMCGEPLNISKQASKEDSDQGMFKHAMDLDEKGQNSEECKYKRKKTVGMV